jgi:Sulfotransferase domain
MKKLDFIGLGAQKAGTSWIHACLYEHPQICMPASKEIHFFSKYYAKGMQWYEEHFRACTCDRVIGEFSPTYLYSPDAPKRIYDYHPQLKLIVCLRDPVARAVSAYRYAIQTRRLSPSTRFDDVMRERSAYIEHSLYTVQLERYLKYFSRDQILITLYEDIALDAYRFMQKVYHFLDVDWHFRPSMAEQKVNVSRGAPRIGALDSLMQRLATSLRRIGLEHVVWVLGRSRAVEVLRRLNTRPSVQQPLSEAQRAALQAIFAPDVRALETLLQKDLRERWFDYEGALERGVHG